MATQAMPKKMRLTVKGPVAKFFNHVLRGQADWNGHNASGWKKDLLNVNGFDERMKFGGEDREMGTRLINAGVKITTCALYGSLYSPGRYAQSVLSACGCQSTNAFRAKRKVVTHVSRNTAL